MTPNGVVQPPRRPLSISSRVRGGRSPNRPLLNYCPPPKRKEMQHVNLEMWNNFFSSCGHFLDLDWHLPDPKAPCHLGGGGGARPEFEEWFEIADFSTVTAWERLAAQLEHLIQPGQNSLKVSSSCSTCQWCRFHVCGQCICLCL